MGFALFTIAIILLFSGVSEGEVNGFGRLVVILLFIASIVFFALFLKRENSTAQPMLDINLFKNRLFSLSVFCSFITFFVLSSCTLMLPYYFQDLRGMSPFLCGLIMLASPLVMMLVAPLSGHASDKIGSEVLTFIGLLIATISLFLIAMIFNQNTMIIVVILIIMMMSIGNGMFQSPNTSLIMGAVTKDKLGIAGSVNGLVRNAGMVLGVSLSSVWIWSFVSHSIGYKVLSYVPENPKAFVYGLHGVFIIEATTCLIGVILTGIRIWSRKPKDVKEDEEEINID